MPLPKESHFTIDDIYALPEGERAELIDGNIYYMAPPSRKHQEFLLELAGVIREYIKKKVVPVSHILPRLLFSERK